LALYQLVPAGRPSRQGSWNWGLLPVAISYATTLILFAQANKLTTAAHAIYLQATAPLYVMLLGPLLLKERIRPRDLWLGLLIALGMSLFLLADPGVSASAPDPAKGNLLAAITGLTWAGVITGFRWLASLPSPPGRGKPNAGVATAILGNVIGFAAALPFALPIAGISFADLATLLYLGMFQVGMAYWLLGKGISHVPAFEASALILLEPALNPVWAWIVHGEKPAPLAILGAAIILLATLWQAYSTSPSTSPPTSSGTSSSAGP
jgi:drug/metabolite transporter (DMT)-like permease